MAGSLNSQSADGTRSVVVVLAVVALVAVVEVLTPGIVRARGVLITRPVPARLKLFFQVGE